MVYFYKSAQCISQTVMAKEIVFHIVQHFVFEWSVPEYIFLHIEAT